MSDRLRSVHLSPRGATAEERTLNEHHPRPGPPSRSSTVQDHIAAVDTGTVVTLDTLGGHVRGRITHHDHSEVVLTAATAAGRGQKTDLRLPWAHIRSVLDPPVPGGAHP